MTLEETDIKEIKIGDVLFSKEYDCKVTVEAFTTNNMIVCVWHDEIGKPYREILDLQQLEMC